MPELDLLTADDLPDDLVSVINLAPMPGLAEGPFSRDTRDAVAELVDGRYGNSLVSAGLWLLAAELDLSHTISQSHSSAEGSFWHGIMHRREGDYSNAKYWFRRVGTHAVHHQLAQQIVSQKIELGAEGFPLVGLTDANEVAFQLVDLSQQAVQQNPQWSAALRKVCWWEWQLLVHHCL